MTRIQSPSRIRDGGSSFRKVVAGMMRGNSNRQEARAAQRGEYRSDRKAKPVCALENIEYPGRRNLLAGRQLDPELAGPGDDRPEQQLIVQQDDDRHGQDGGADRRPVPFVVRLGDIGADAGQRDRRVAYSDRLRRDDEKPSARHRHHCVPDEVGHRERRLELPELLPTGQAKAACDLLQIGRDGAQRLVEGESHIPGLASEDGEDRRQFRTQRIAGEEAEEEGDGEG